MEPTLNIEVRKYLIEKSRTDSPVFYEDVVKDNRLNLDLSAQEDRNKLSEILGEISKFEHEHGRPLLSSMAIYKRTRDHGNMFYVISEKMGYGKWQQLKDRMFGFEEQAKSREFWRSEENYKKFLATDVQKDHALAFFKDQEIDFLAGWAGKVYDKENEEHIAAKNYIMNSLGSKTVYWSNELVTRLDGFETFNWRMWSQKGWDNSGGINKQVARFKEYSWARIYKRGDENKDIFFTVGADSKERALIYKMDYYFESNSNLTDDQKRIVDTNIPAGLRWKTIPASRFNEYDWERLLSETAKFIAENTATYDRLIELVWGVGDVKQIFTNCLRRCTPDLKSLDTLPLLNPSFQGTEKDFLKSAVEKKETGDAGEELVVLYEKSRLKALGKHHLANKVIRTADGKGFDVLSFDLNEKEVFIEVKTTTGNENVPFYLSLNEYLFAERNPKTYLIYRLYNYDDESNKADFYKIENPLGRLLFQPMSYKVYHKAGAGDNK